MQCIFCYGYGLFKKEGRTIEEGYCCIWKNNSHSWDSCALRKKVQVSATGECFATFVHEASCLQPHYKIEKKSGDMVHTLVLFPMNTTKTNVYEYMNSMVQRICNRRGINIIRFWKLWKEEFPHVQIPPYSQFS